MLYFDTVLVVMILSLRVFLHKADISKCVQTLRAIFELEPSTVRYGGRKNTLTLYPHHLLCLFSVHRIQEHGEWTISGDWYVLVHFISRLLR